MSALALLWAALLSFAGSTAAAAASDSRDTTTVDADLAAPTLQRCDSWVATGLAAYVTEGKRWEFGYPDFSNRTKSLAGIQSCSSATQRSVRVGPFTTQAGGTYDITSAIIDSMFNVGDRITSFTAVPVTRSGEPIGYPPLYVHHIHVGRLTSYYDEHWFTSHGDYSVGSDFGIGARSTAGYATFLPKGHYFAVDCPIPFAVQAIIQDMRTVRSAPDLRSVFIEVTFGLALSEAEPAIEPATLVWNEAPHGPFGYSRFAVLAEPSMSWWTMRWPASGELLPSAKLHSHFSRHHRLFLLDEAPRELAFFASHVKGIEYVHDSVPPTSGHETMLLVNLSHTEQTLSRLPSVLCRDNSSMPSYLVAATPGHPNASRWARRRDFNCQPHTVREGSISTFVQLYRTVADQDVRLFPMHTNTWFYIRRPGASSSFDLKTVSYRYATYRTESLSEPLQDDAFGSCREKPSPAAVAKYVSDNLAGLSQAVNDHHVDATRVPAASLVGEAARGRILTVLGVGTAGLLSGGLLLLGVRAARVGASALV